jgi:hypothetical protein
MLDFMHSIPGLEESPVLLLLMIVYQFGKHTKHYLGQNQVLMILFGLHFLRKHGQKLMVITRE